MAIKIVKYIQAEIIVSAFLAQQFFGKFVCSAEWVAYAIYVPQILSAFVRQQTVHDHIMNDRSKPFYFLVAPGWVNPIGQQNNNDKPFKIYPERGPGKSQMPDAFLRKNRSTASAGEARRVKPQSFVGSGQSFEKSMQQIFFK